MPAPATRPTSGSPSPSLPDSVVSLELTVIPHPRLAEATNSIGLLHARSRAPRLKAKCVLVVGESGAGKSTLLEEYQRSYPTVTLEDVEKGSIDPGFLTKRQQKNLKEADQKRVISIELKIRPTEKSITGEIIAAFGYSTIPSWTTKEMIDKIKHYAAEFGTEMILIDEAHHLINERNPDASEPVSEFLKSILNQIGVQIVLAGLPKLRKLREYKQFWRRLQPDILIDPYDWCTVDGRVQFLALLGRFDKLLRLPRLSGLHEHEFAMRMYVATGGEVGIVAKLLSEALLRAHLRGLDRLTLDLMAEVHTAFANDEQREEQVLDFDEILAEVDENQRNTPLQADDNPFLCAKAKLRALHLATNSDHADKSLSVIRRARGRATGSRGSGRPPYTPMATSA